MANYLSDIAGQLGISIWLFIVILIWSGIWKLLGLWRAAKENSVVWFVVIGITNTLGILPILYIYVFSKMAKKKKGKKKKAGKKKKKK